MHLRSFGLPILGTVLLGACHQPPVQSASSALPPSLVSVSSVVNVVKCELNYTFAQDKAFLALIGAKDGKHGKVSGTLHLENVVANSTNTSASLEFSPANITIGPSGSISTKRTNTQTVDVKFDLDIDPAASPPSQCVDVDPTSQKRLEIEGHPFVALLHGILGEYGKINPGNPKIQLGTLEYTSGFDVEESMSGGLKLAFLIFSAEHTRERGYTTSQSLELDFDLSSLPPRR